MAGGGKTSVDQHAWSPMMYILYTLRPLDSQQKDVQLKSVGLDGFNERKKKHIERGL